MKKILFIIKKANAHKKILKDRIATDSPNRTINTPIIIGFLTYRYGPAITNFLVGFQGAKVPFPILMNREIQTIMSDKPKHIISNPIIKTEMFPGEIFFSIPKGTITNTAMGRINEKICFAKDFNFLTSIIVRVSTWLP